MKYKVIIISDETKLEWTLNNWSKAGWRFHSVETEYKKNIIVMEKKDDKI